MSLSLAISTCILYSVVGFDPFRIAKYDAPTTAWIGMEQVRHDIASGFQQLTPTWSHQVWTLRKYSMTPSPNPMCKMQMPIGKLNL